MLLQICPPVGGTACTTNTNHKVAPTDFGQMKAPSVLLVAVLTFSFVHCNCLRTGKHVDSSTTSRNILQARYLPRSSVCKLRVACQSFRSARHIRTLTVDDVTILGGIYARFHDSWHGTIYLASGHPRSLLRHEPGRTYTALSTLTFFKLSYEC